MVIGGSGTVRSWCNGWRATASGGGGIEGWVLVSCLPRSLVAGGGHGGMPVKLSKTISRRRWGRCRVYLLARMMEDIADENEASASKIVVLVLHIQGPKTGVGEDRNSFERDNKPFLRSF